MNIPQSISDYENWRDSQHDRPEPDPQTPDETTVKTYTHDYDNDTSMVYTRTGQEVGLVLTFSSEDPDAGTEELHYHGTGGESMREMVHDLHQEMKAYLDSKDSSSFFEQQTFPTEIHSVEDYYDSFTRTALYAFEGLLKETEQELTTEEKTVWHAIEPERKDWLYSAREQTDQERGCIGHLRGDFGRSGQEFCTSWFDHQPALKNAVFRDELHQVINDLRKPGGMLESFSAMRKACESGLHHEDSYGFRLETKHYDYCLRCIPRRGDYNFYVYCYDREAQREQTRSSIKEALKQPSVPSAHKNKTNKEMEI